MDNFEKVEKIREKTGVSYTEAKEALEKCNYDMLDAIVYLEQAGRVEEPETPEYTIEDKRNVNSKRFENTQRQYERDCRRHSTDNFKEGFSMIGKGLLKLFQVDFIVTRKHEKIVAMPIILFLIFLIGFFWVTLPLLVIGLFLGCRYSFVGFGEEADRDINDICDRVANGADDLKRGFGNNDNNNY